jgi:hypothetical protein
MRRGRPKGDALDRLEYEDRALLELARAFADEGLDRRQHGEIVELLIEHLAIREAAREIVADGLAKVDEVRGLADRLRAGTVARRADLVRLEELGRGVQPTNLNQGQDIDAVVAEILPALRQHVDAELGEIIPEVRRRLPLERRAKVLRSARYVVRHAPTHPGVHPRRWYERIGPLVRLHAVYDFLRGFPGGGAKPNAEVELPSGEKVP